ncbi:thermonuclease family protein [Terasakiella sp. SH-1]|uniref:thermonuclease family protein n=1 Tax=Terasakiella sp. SH-1 TaxID=2560057 RepID=UPI001073C3CE|nr:thermonuclease family protein [Terasakiella sp. SH-1]
MLGVKIQGHTSGKTYRKHAHQESSVTEGVSIDNFILSAENVNDDYHRENNRAKYVMYDFSFSFEGFDKPNDLISFEHKNSVLSCVKRLGGWNVWRGVPVLATHLYLANFITGYVPFGVCKVLKNAEKRGISIIYRACAVFLSCLLFASPVFSDVPARVLYVIDGDTFKARINVDGQFHQTSVRVAHIDTPETKIGVQCPAERLAGKKATRFAKGILKKKMQVTLQDIKPGFYPGRIIAAVKLPDQRDFGQLMLNAGYAVPYEGGKKRKVWCN